MRQLERIDIILDVLDIKQFLLDLEIDPKIADDCDIKVIECWEEFVKFWKKNPDQRLTQCLINIGFLSNLPGFWYYKEEDQYCIDKGLLKTEEIRFWGQNYDKKGKRLPKTNYILLKDLKTDHIQAILEYFKDRLYQLPTSYKEYFYERLVNDKNNSKVKKKTVFTKKEIKQFKELNNMRKMTKVKKNKTQVRVANNIYKIISSGSYKVRMYVDPNVRISKNFKKLKDAKEFKNTMMYAAYIH